MMRTSESHRLRPAAEPLEARRLLSGKAPLNLLFFGNSDTYNTSDGTQYNMPAALSSIAVAAGFSAPNVYEQILLGETLADQLNTISSAASSNIIASSLPAGQQWSDVVMQEYSTRPTNAMSLEGDVPLFLSDSLQLLNEVRANSPSVQGVLYETWARGVLNSVYPTNYSDPTEMQNQLQDNYALAAAGINAADGSGSSVVAPVGEAWRALDWESSLYSNIAADGVEYHPSTEGELLNAMVLFDTIYHADVSTIAAANVGALLSTLGLSTSIWDTLAPVADSVAGVPTVSPVQGSLSGTSSTAAASYNLTALGTSDWAHWGLGGNSSAFDDKSSGETQISNVAQVGSGDYGGYTNAGRVVSWSDGEPVSSDANDDGYIWANNVIGAGYSFAVPASTSSQTLDVYLGGYSSGGTLTAQLSDGSAADYSVSFSGASTYTDLVAITFNAASAGQTLTLTYTKSTNINGTGGSVDLIAAWLAGATLAGTAPSVTTNPVNQSVIAGAAATFTAAASGNPTPTVQWMVETAGSGSFAAISGATSTALAVPATTVSESGNEYEAVFSNGVGSAATTTAAKLTVNAAPSGGSLSGTSSVAASSYDLTTLGESDWAHWGTGDVASAFDHKATGGSQISNVTEVGSGGGYGSYYNTSRDVTWIDGTPLASDAGDDGYLWANNAIGAGYSFTVPATTSSQTLYVYLGGYSSGSTLTAHLSDGSAADYSVSFSGSGLYTNLVAITFNAASAGQTLTLTYVKSSNINGTGGSADLIAAWLAGPAVSAAPLVTTNPSNQSVTAGATASFTAAASGNPTPTVQWMVETAGSGTFTAISGATSTTLSLPATTVALSGNEYEAVFSNGVGSPATTTAATLTVNAAPTSGSLSGTSSAASGSYNLTTLGISDWAHWGRGGEYGVFDDKSAGDTQISNVTTVGTGGQFGGYTDSSRSVTWSDGLQLTSDAGDHGYIWANTAIGAGYTFTAPADTTSRTLYVYLGGYSSGSTLTATLSDNSAPAYSVSFSGNALYSEVVAITYKAASTNQKISISYTKSSNINGTGGSADLISAWLVGAAPSIAPVVTTNPISQGLTVGASAVFTAAASGSPAPSVQWMVETAGTGSFAAISGATATTLNLGAATLAENGNEYEAVFSNGVGSPATTTAATLSVSAAASGGSLTGSASSAATSFNLTTLGTSDWAHWGTSGTYGVFDHDSTGDSQISNVTLLGTGGQYGGYTDASRTVSWSNGLQLASDAGDHGYVWANSAIGAGYSFTAPADTTSRTLYVYLGGYSSGSTLTATLSDNSAPAYTVSFSGNAIYSDVVSITYHAASANQKITISYTKSSNINGTGGSADLIAAWLTGGTPVPAVAAPLTIMPLGDSITAGVGLDANTTSSPNYREPLYSDLTAAGYAIQFEGVNNPSNNSEPGYCPTLYNIGQNDNNGFEGYVSGDILANLSGEQAPAYFDISNQGGYWLSGGGGTGRSAVYPNVVLLMIGTNDANDGVALGISTTAGTLEGNVTAILNWFATNRPSTEVIVGGAIPNENTTSNAEIVPYDAWLASEVPTFANDRFVNMYALFTNSDGSINTNLLQADGIHPTSVGYTDLATAWAGAIEASQ